MSKPVLGLILATGTLLACGGGSQAPAPASPEPGATSAPQATASPASEAQAHDIHARITEIAADRRSVTLDHEAIPGVMAAMTMPYKVDDPSVLEGLAVGDTVHGRMEVRPGGQYFVTRLSK